MTTPAPPKRAFHLTLGIAADSRDDLVQALEQYAYEIAADKVSVGCSGGYSWGSIYRLTVNPDMTHDRYFDLNQAYLDELEKVK